ncbi:MAG: ribonucleoside-triphosphate reductase [Candidatus Zambryskibacteria bacterium RIFCSPLOWO2_02_FULL_51_21]|uniref:Ribonucleoside-triphosphate reductase n=1 Tax=Candidatus Zambryskibacteria bacterium RIFCSPHIGHO2_02_FULL_43_37 TaxID=1802749 RepID=A0A1G2TH05_9BACT|nr:MAG: ribonucleoside-triphosphate reductase [Candidatus Zambryskibacteria bacterium RIFCSPHIGHO2_01_FULL_52_18]OHA96586.1 MAG: ribonucleoside-triphosphate reductase [Candidatus Zambryskibacteria bacterium RIFCSPHIGHO2_02_FULL_43_37]OHB07635.1 MAG: ribonucleoside-triphosphate reductase [Candidatus Zambryskibacteria bacterium RIFCSPLOWO2_01_FULL_52_12]OHB11150.1 MAG: ribonucleoside-triphosphate reductase [Candidatus Zambryskibacteria bacterium RIFCSPLOWO2_02_FULL_51_21]
MPKKAPATRPSRLSNIIKRDGSTVPFNPDKITHAVTKALQEAKEYRPGVAEKITESVVRKLSLRRSFDKKFVPTVEGIQDLVEMELMLQKLTATAKAYILYRAERTKAREHTALIPQEVKDKIADSSKYFKTPYQEFIFYQFYSKWRPELGRRETWIEAIDRFMEYMKGKMGDALTSSEYSEVREAILVQDICPSMRLLWSAGKAADASNVTAYNCAYIAPTSWRDLSEIMYVSMCGAGCGFSVEPENVGKFPQIQKQTGQMAPKITIEDSKEGWCNAYVAACTAWEKGKDVELDYSLIRPAGAKLATMGGRASGPAPLQELMQFTRRKMLAKQGRRLSTLDLHDIICQIGLIVVAGGVRRSALISLSSLDDTEVRDAKKGAFWQTEGQRSMANNSAVYEAKPTAEEFMQEWTALVTSHSGERGIFNRGSLSAQVPKRRWDVLKKAKQPGVNPCGEIYLQSKQFCNLTSIVVRPGDDMENLKRKMRLATLLGTYQATLTDFGYLSKEWKKNCEKEQLLGVSITGYYDNKLVRNDKNLQILREESMKTNKKYAKRFGKNESTAITCVKPHGNSGQLLGVGSGMHTWYSHYYIRRVRISANDPLLKLARNQGVPVFPEVGYSTSNAATMVMEFPCKAPEGALVNKDVTALEMLEEWKRLKVHFTEHNPSVTIYIGDDEWISVANFVYKNWDIVGGLSFLPRNNHVYQLAPYEEITKEEYERRLKELGHLDFSKLVAYEQEDMTNGAKELACAGGVCETDFVPVEATA